MRWCVPKTRPGTTGRDGGAPPLSPSKPPPKPHNCQTGTPDFTTGNAPAPTSQLSTRDPPNLGASNEKGRPPGSQGRILPVLPPSPLSTDGVEDPWNQGVSWVRTRGERERVGGIGRSSDRPCLVPFGCHHGLFPSEEGSSIRSSHGSFPHPSTGEQGGKDRMDRPWTSPDGNPFPFPFRKEKKPREIERRTRVGPGGSGHPGSDRKGANLVTTARPRSRRRKTNTKATWQERWKGAAPCWCTSTKQPPKTKSRKHWKTETTKPKPKP